MLCDSGREAGGTDKEKSAREPLQSDCSLANARAFTQHEGEPLYFQIYI